jgi:hypothetical protein
MKSERAFHDNSKRKSQWKETAWLREILRLCFAALAIPACLYTPILLHYFLVRNLNSPFQAEFFIMAAGQILLIGMTGIVCLVIYKIMKNHLGKNEDLFL